jgi:branched-chain amino acid aminotransferase
VIITPPLTASILDGISRRSIITIARDRGYEVVERDIARAELILADEVFATGTAAELVGLCEIDDQTIGAGGVGPITAELQDAFHDALRGRDERYTDWLDVVQTPSRAAAG